ncbi:general negative regulator of transcription subunit 3-like isoform X10 [Magnolia sinica]|uniref:general negative regulator of transcription subunit 3-like isoform X10 n=1 Tax=Magnolia sinica TaxID=86752 RepID=UPI00265896D9|nr:general negative regulator of transcription subunit 3-like isoform X10 [Magnolia sinica]
MGASRKLQGEIDRVLKKVQEGVDVFDSIWNKVYDTDNANQKEKFEADLKKEIKKLQRYRDQIKTWIQSSEIKDKKVSASYEQALLDARKLIEREMERFKVCEKETKTKAFSKEGLGQQPKTDPKEKAKSETRDWLNNVVGELESQIDYFEAEIEGLSVKKGKMRPPRLTHLEASIVRHKAHIIKLELILRLLDNDELSPDQVNDVRDFLEDYVERNQEDFDEFSDVDELYNSLPLDKVESLEDLVAIVPPALVKGIVPIASASAVLSLKPSSPASPSQSSAMLASAAQQGTLIQDQAEETASQDSNSDIGPSTPSKNGTCGCSVLSTTSTTGPGMPTGTNTTPATGSIPTHNLAGGSTASAILSGPGYALGVVENVTNAASSSPINLTTLVKEDDNASFPGGRSSPALAEIGTGRGIGRGSVVGGIANQTSTVSLNLSSGTGLPSSETLGAVLAVSDISKRNILGSDERIGGGGLVQPPVSPISNRMLLQQTSKSSDGAGTTDSNNVGEVSVIGGRVFSLPLVSGGQWRSHSPSSFQNQNETGQLRGRTEIAPDMQLFQQVQQQGHSTGLGASHLAGTNPKQFPTQQQNSLLQQAGVSGSSAEATQVPRDTDLSPGQPLQSNQSSVSLGVIGRRGFSDLGAIGDNLSASIGNSGGMHDQSYNLQMLDASYYKLPQPKDSERAKNYVPRRPVKTPPSYPQVQAPIVDNPAFWERLGLDTLGTDTLFFAFYYQQNTYQQYLAARELKKQSWRYHRKYNTWFQRHEEPKVTTDEYEQGTYVYFDFHIADDDLQHGWCQRIKTEFTFEYSYLEDELVV